MPQIDDAVELASLWTLNVNAGVMPEMNSILDITRRLSEEASPKLRVTDAVSGTVVRSTQSDSLGRPHLITAILKFDISNTFTEWEQAFLYSSTCSSSRGSI